MSVVFPQPDGPSSINNSPVRISKSTPRNAWTAALPSPYVLVMPAQRIAVWSGLSVGLGGAAMGNELSDYLPARNETGCIFKTGRILNAAAPTLTRTTATPPTTGANHIKR